MVRHGHCDRGVRDTNKWDPLFPAVSSALRRLHRRAELRGALEAENREGHKLGTRGGKRERF